MTTTDTATLAQQQAAGLRALADMIENNSYLAQETRYVLDQINVPVSHAEDPKGALAAFIRAAKAHGATVTKDNNDQWGGVILTWGKVGLYVYAKREQVCERVVTGSETVTKTVPDPDALALVPTVEVTETVETYRWECSPLLAAAEAVSS